MKPTKLTSPIILLLSIIVLINCNKPNLQYYKVAGYAQGTTYNITYQGLEDYSFEIDSLLKKFDESLSTYKDNSIISRINQNDPEVSSDYLLNKVINTSFEVWEETNGAFDLTLAPIVNAWGFGFTKASDISDELIDSLLNLTGMTKIRLEDNKVIKDYPNIMLDGNAIAQGYSVDYICDFLDNNLSKNYLVEIGGELKAKGINYKSDIWRVGVDKPIDNSETAEHDLQAIIQLENKSMATSGNYRKFYKKDGVKYSHTIDPSTGYPVNHTLLSATVITDDCIYADAYATAFMVMGYEKSIEFVKSHPEIGIYLIADNGNGEYKTYYSEGMKDNILDEME